jgi:hypothetical protein
LPAFLGNLAGGIRKFVDSIFALTNGSRTTLATLTVLPVAANYGRAITLTALITLNPLVPGMPAGDVTFKDGGNALGAAVTLDANGQAQFVTTNLAAGQHNLTADYAGSIGYAPSTSSAVVYAIAKAATNAAVVSSPQPTVFGQQATFEATVTAPAPGALAPTGSVIFFDGATNLGAGVLSTAGKATFATAALAAGTHANITAQYGGDVN